MRRSLPVVVLPIVAMSGLAGPVWSSARQLDAHEHGKGELNIAIEGTEVAMEFKVPGHDIVGFEYEAKTDEDLAKIDDAIATLSSPLALFAPSAAANCTLVDAKASLREDHHDHDEHAEGEDHHDEDHDHDEHAEGEDHHDEDHDHDEHAEGEDHHDEDHGARHATFKATYSLTCDAPDKLTQIELPYFQTFPNAEKLAVQVITDTGATAYVASREAPVVDF